MILNKHEITTILNHSQSIKQRIFDIFKEYADAFGLSVPQLLVIFTVGNNEVHNVKEIAKRLTLQPTNTSSLCKQMAEMGLLHRTRDTVDVRVVNITLTQTGQRLYAELSENLEDRMRQVRSNDINIRKIADAFHEIEKLIEILGDSYE